MKSDPDANDLPKSGPLAIVAMRWVLRRSTPGWEHGGAGSLQLLDVSRHHVGNRPISRQGAHGRTRSAIRTGRPVVRNRWCETEPSIRLPKSPMRLEPITITSAFQASAMSATVFATGPA